MVAFGREDGQDRTCRCHARTGRPVPRSDQQAVPGTREAKGRRRSRRRSLRRRCECLVNRVAPELAQETPEVAAENLYTRLCAAHRPPPQARSCSPSGSRPKPRSWRPPRTITPRPSSSSSTRLPECAVRLVMSFRPPRNDREFPAAIWLVVKDRFAKHTACAAVEAYLRRRSHSSTRRTEPADRRAGQGLDGHSTAARPGQLHDRRGAEPARPDGTSKRPRPARRPGLPGAGRARRLRSAWAADKQGDEQPRTKPGTSVSRRARVAPPISHPSIESDEHDDAVIVGARPAVRPWASRR